jgi:hypothetical protein
VLKVSYIRAAVRPTENNYLHPTPRFDSFNMSSTKTRISFEGWITITAFVLIVATAIGMICVDQVNRASIEECNKRIDCSSSLNPQSAQMKADESLISAAPDDKSPSQPETRTETSDIYLPTTSIPPEKRGYILSR